MITPASHKVKENLNSQIRNMTLDRYFLFKAIQVQKYFYSCVLIIITQIFLRIQVTDVLASKYAAFSIENFISQPYLECSIFKDITTTFIKELCFRRWQMCSTCIMRKGWPHNNFWNGSSSSTHLNFLKWKIIHINSTVFA